MSKLRSCKLLGISADVSAATAGKLKPQSHRPTIWGPCHSDHSEHLAESRYIVWCPMASKVEAEEDRQFGLGQSKLHKGRHAT